MPPVRPRYLAAVLALSLTGCAPQEDDAFEEGFPELGVSAQDLNMLIGSCKFVSGTVTVSSGGAQTIVIGKRAVDSVILVNGEDCKTVATARVPATAANSSTMKRLLVTGTTQDESVILDFSGGVFAPGVSSFAAGGISVDLGGGNDSVSIQGSSTADSFFIGSEGLAFNSDNYKDLTFSGVESLTVALGAGADALTATLDKLTKGVSGSAALPLTVFGGSGNDVIVGGRRDDTINGGPGNDTLSGGAGTDSLFGEDGADVIQASVFADGDDTIDCGSDASPDGALDVVSYSLRTRAISATAGNPGFGGESGENDSIDTNCEGITGGTNNDTLVGDGTNNTLQGGPGNDTLTGALGDDTLNGGDGNDSFDEESMPTGADVFIGGAGTDTVNYGGRAGNLSITMDGIAANDGADGEGDNVKADVENVLCGSGDDSVLGNALPNTITGGDGNDALSGGGGPDTFMEGSLPNGADTFTGGNGADTVHYGARSTALAITMGDDTANDGDVSSSEKDNVGSDVENLIAGSANDSVTGNALANVIEGGLGSDTLSGLAGDDQLDGTDGAPAVNNISCGEGADIALNKGAGTYSFDCELKGN